MDAYILQQKLLDAWRQLAPNFVASDVKKMYNSVPVYIEINGELVLVTDMVIVDNKAVLKC